MAPWGLLPDPPSNPAAPRTPGRSPRPAPPRGRRCGGRPPGSSRCSTRPRAPRPSASPSPTAPGTSGWARASPTTMSDAMEWPSTAICPPPGSPRANPATASIASISTALRALLSARPPVSGAGLRPWPGKSNVTTRNPFCANVTANGSMSCCDPANPCATTTTGAGPVADRANTVTGMAPTRPDETTRPASAASNCHSPTRIAAAARTATASLDAICICLLVPRPYRWPRLSRCCYSPCVMSTLLAAVPPNAPTTLPRPHAVVIGSGFGGLAAAVRLGARACSARMASPSTPAPPSSPRRSCWRNSGRCAAVACRMTWSCGPSARSTFYVWIRGPS